MGALRLTLEVAPRYLRGLPMIALVTIENTTDKIAYRGVEPCRLLAARHPVEIAWSRGAQRFEPEPVDAPEGPLRGVLSPRHTLSGVVDLSLRTNRDVGEWMVGVAYAIGEQRIEAEARVRIEEPPASVTSAALQLRADNDLGVAEWYALSLAHPDPIAPEILDALGEDGRRELALHVFLRDAIHGAPSLREIDPAPLLAIAGPAEVEAALLRHELACIRGDDRARGLGTAIRERWPGTAARIEATRAGQGTLAALRAFYGA